MQKEIYYMSIQPCNTQCSDFTVCGWEKDLPDYEPVKKNPGYSYLESFRSYLSSLLFTSSFSTRVKNDFSLSCNDWNQIRTVEKITKRIKKEMNIPLIRVADKQALMFSNTSATQVEKIIRTVMKEKPSYLIVKGKKNKKGQLFVVKFIDGRKEYMNTKKTMSKAMIETVGTASLHSRQFVANQLIV